MMIVQSEPSYLWLERMLANARAQNIKHREHCRGVAGLANKPLPTYYLVYHR